MKDLSAEDLLNVAIFDMTFEGLEEIAARAFLGLPASDSGRLQAHGSISKNYNKYDFSGFDN